MNPKGSGGIGSVDNGHGHLIGMGQLSLVEHALCPLDSGHSLRPRLVHECEYRYSDKRGSRRTARVRVTCPLGLSAQDEFYLWGLLALTFSQPAPQVEFHATPHYCLKQLGVIDAGGRRGGRQYRQFAAALERLAAVRYQNHAFYDPVRAEHRRVSFGLFSYSLPLSTESSRAWRIVWDPLLFELVSAIGGHLRFDLNVYRELDPASRRLFLLLGKMFRRSTRPAVFDLRHLAVQVLGFAPTVATRDLKSKVGRCIRRLADREVVRQSEPEAIVVVAYDVPVGRMDPDEVELPGKAVTLQIEPGAKVAAPVVDVMTSGAVQSHNHILGGPGAYHGVGNSGGAVSEHQVLEEASVAVVPRKRALPQRRHRSG